jgi:hypothetical protein
MGAAQEETAGGLRQTGAKFAGAAAENRYPALAALFLIELRKCYLCRY